MYLRGRAEAAESDAGLEEVLASILREARASLPGVSLPDEAFLAHLSARVPSGSSPDEVATKDLFLACACLARDPRALAIFDQGYIARVRGFVAHLRLQPASVEELAQQLRCELLLGDAERAPKLGSYRGQGDLLGWVRVIAVRAGLRLVPVKNEDGDEALAQVASKDPSAESALLKSTHQAAFMAAFKQAMASLSDREQNLLRQHYLDDLSIDRLSVLYGVHRSRCARWLQKTRETLLRRTQQGLMAQNRVSRDECESLIRQAQSRLDVSLRSLLS